MLQKKQVMIFSLSIIILLFVYSLSWCSHDYCSTNWGSPPFISSFLKPNVLIILDNSNSMDEDFYGNAVGSYSPASKSVVAKQAIIQIINKYRDKLRVGLMTYRLDNNVEAKELHNSFYFTSYDPKSYCPSQKVCSDDTGRFCNSSDECTGECLDPCVEYCKGNTTYRDACLSQCNEINPSFDINYFDEILNYYPNGSEEKNRYCKLVFPKRQRFPNPSDSSNYIYYKLSLPFYSDSAYIKGFCYSDNYRAAERNPYDHYLCYRNKTGTSDNYEGYSNYYFSAIFVPTDSDFALGFYDFGRRLSWIYIGKTWFSNSSPGDGYLQIPINDLVDENGNPLNTLTNLLEKLDPKVNDESGYMSCNRSNKNKCNYVINAGLTPTAGTLETAKKYFAGELSNYDTPIQYRCQKNFIIYVTDGLPSVDKNGHEDTTDNLMSEVISEIDMLRNLSVYVGDDNYTFDIKTYILGVGLSEEARNYLDTMAIHGGTDNNGHAYYATNSEELFTALNKIFTDILHQLSSGTSISVLTSKGSKGNNMVQAVFYPDKLFGDNKIDWIGFLYNYWLYVDRNTSNFREDSIDNKKLDVCSSTLTAGGDYILDFIITPEGDLNIKAYKSKCDGSIFSLAKTYTSLEELNPVWEGGTKLSKLSTSDRIIYTVVNRNNLTPSSPVNLERWDDLNCNDTTSLKILGDDNQDGIIDNSSETYRYISTPISCENIKDFILGEEISGYRSRKIQTNDIWKLGDIIYSTPQIVQHNKKYTSSKKSYSVVYVGANDGMLHAFKLGHIRFDKLSANQTAKICEDNSKNCYINEIGKEIWSFIPKNIIPYLRFLTDPQYCHLYFIDLQPYIYTIDNDKDDIPDKIILIGGMRLGGAVGNNDAEAIHPPQDSCQDPRNYSSKNSNCTGLSSYFALDITNPENPKFLWEFSDPDLGFSYSGPAIIKYNNNYYVMFLSGPTNYRGDIHQNLKVYILKLNNNFTIKNNGILKFPDDLPGSSAFFSRYHNAFGGRLFTNGIDFDEDGNTDLVAFGITQKDGSRWQGNLGFVIVNNEDPKEWHFETAFNSAIKPILTKITYMKCFDHHYLYFGTGRWFFKEDEIGQNSNDVEKIYGVLIDGCLTGNNCNINNIHSNNNICSELPTTTNDLTITTAWVQELRAKENNFYKERSTTDPTISNLNIIMFTTFQPSSDPCTFGGRSRVWALNCATGGPINDNSCPPYTDLNPEGTIYLQLSRGNIVRINLSPDSFSSEGNKASNWHTGVPPESPTQFIAPLSSPKGKIIYWLEK